MEDLSEPVSIKELYGRIPKPIRGKMTPSEGTVCKNPLALSIREMDKVAKMTKSNYKYVYECLKLQDEINLMTEE